MLETSCTAKVTRTLVSCVALCIAYAAQAEEIIEFRIAPQSLETALLAFADQTGAQVATSSDSIADLRTNGVSGRMTPRSALQQLIAGSDLEIRSQGEHSFSLLARPEGAHSSSEAARSPAREATANPGADREEENSTGRSTEGTDGIRPAEDASIPAMLEEIIVTATRRAERVQDVPISIAVIGNEDIERRGVIGMEDYLRAIPGVTQVDNGARGNAIVMRGITTAPELENINGTTVATYFDETPITSAGGRGAGGIDVRPVDIERIEVLRGPQGTTFGSGSLGGTLRIIPNKPRLDGFGGKLAAAYSSTEHLGGDNTMLQGVVNLPLVADEFGVRAAGYRYDDSGFYENTAGIDPAAVARAEAAGLGDYVRGFHEKDVGRMLTTGGRLAALWQATDELSFNLNFLTQTIEQDGLPVATVGPYRHNSIPIAPQGRIRGGKGENSETEMDLLNLSMNYDLTSMSWTSTVSWIDASSIYARDQTEILGFYNSSTVPSQFDSFNAESRLATRLPGRWQFLVGAYYEDIEDGSAQAIHWPGSPATANRFGTDPIALVDVDRELNQRAAFGEVAYELTDMLTATVGGRYYKYSKDESTLREGGLFRVPLGAGTPTVLSSTEDGTNFKASLDYKPTPESLLYVSWAEGFRLGRPQAGLPPLTCDTDNDGLIDGSSISIQSTRSVAPDSLENYELGGKFALFGQRLAIDASIYYIEWDGLPTTATARCGTSTLNYTTNAGGATSEGVEFQASWYVADGFRLDFGAGYTNARLSVAAPLQGWADDARLPGAPKASANLTAQYDFQVAGQRAFVRADSLYTGEFNGDLLGTEGLKAGDYTKIDARAGLSFDHVRVELFVRNLTDEDAFTWRSLGGGTQRYVGYRLRPRTIGIQLGYDF